MHARIIHGRVPRNSGALERTPCADGGVQATDSWKSRAPQVPVGIWRRMRNAAPDGLMPKASSGWAVWIRMAG